MAGAADGATSTNAHANKAKEDLDSCEQQSVAEQVEAYRYLERNKASRRKGLKVKFVQLEPPSAA